MKVIRRTVAVSHIYISTKACISNDDDEHYHENCKYAPYSTRNVSICNNKKWIIFKHLYSETIQDCFYIV
jgi:ubiquinone biosynthesis protein COQ9